MAKRPEKTIALYRREQVEAYEAARAQLVAEGVDVEEHSEGDVLATISARYAATDTQSTDSDTGDNHGGENPYLSILALIGPALGMLIVLSAVAVTLAWYLL